MPVTFVWLLVLCLAMGFGASGQCLFGSDCAGASGPRTCAGQTFCCPAGCSGTDLVCINDVPSCTCSGCPTATTTQAATATAPISISTWSPPVPVSTTHDAGQCLFDADCATASTTRTCGGRTICCSANCGSQSFNCFNGVPTCTCERCTSDSGGCTREVDDGEIVEPASNADQELFLAVTLGILGGVWLIAQGVALARSRWCTDANADDLDDSETKDKDTRDDSHEPWLLAKLTDLGGVKDKSGRYLSALSCVIKSHELLPLCIGGEEMRVRCDLVHAAEIMFGLILSLSFSVVFASLNNGTVTKREVCRSGSVMTTTVSAESSGSFSAEKDIKAAAMVALLELVQMMPYNALCSATKPRPIIGRALYGLVVVGILVLAFLLAARDAKQITLYLLVLLTSKVLNWIILGPVEALLTWFALVKVLPRCFCARSGHNLPPPTKAEALGEPLLQTESVEDPLSLREFAVNEEAKGERDRDPALCGSTGFGCDV